MPTTVEIPGIGDVDFPDEMSHADITSAIPTILKQHHAKNLAAGAEAEKKVSNVERVSNILGAGTRMLGMLGGPAGAALAEFPAEAIEKAGSRTPSPLTPTFRTIPRAALNAGIAAIPGGYLGKGILGSAAEGAITGAGIGTVSPLIEGQLPTPEGIATSAATGGALGGMIPGAKTIGAYRASKRATRFEPESAVNDVLKSLEVKGTGGAPGAKIAPEIEMVREAHPEIHNELKVQGKKFEDVTRRDYANAAHSRKKSFWQEETGKGLEKFGHTPEPTTPVADSIFNSIGEITQEANPKLKETIIQRANLYDGKTKSLNAIHERIKELRKTRESLNNPLTRAEILNTPEMAANMRELEGLENVFANRMSQLTGKDYSKVNFRYKSLAQTEEMARDAAGAGEVETRKQLATRHKVGETILNAPGAYEAGAKLTKQAIGKMMRNPNDPDRLIGQSLLKLGGKNRSAPIGPRPSESPTNPGTTLMQPPPEGPYAGQPGPTEPNMSMDQYLTLQKLSPEARQFLGYGRKQIPPPPSKPLGGSERGSFSTKPTESTQPASEPDMFNPTAKQGARFTRERSPFEKWKSQWTPAQWKQLIADPEFSGYAKRKQMGMAQEVADKRFPTIPPPPTQ